MEQYIRKSAVVAEIERMLETITNDSEQDVRDRDLGAIYSAQLLVLRNLAKYLDTLEVKEVDLEKEIKDWWNTHYPSKNYTFEGYTGHYIENFTLIEIAKHFFELGLKA